MSIARAMRRKHLEDRGAHELDALPDSDTCSVVANRKGAAAGKRHFQRRLSPLLIARPRPIEVDREGAA
ncbi:hypothetical protein D3C87_2194420 [compost metagenome]